MFEGDTSSSMDVICLPRKGSQVRYHYYHFYSGNRPWPAVAGWTPLADLYETAEEYVLEVNLAGVDPDVVQVHIQNNAVHISGERVEHGESATRCYHVMEIERGGFIRIVELPTPVDPHTANATTHHGMLVIRVNKSRDGLIHGCDSANSMEGLE